MSEILDRLDSFITTYDKVKSESINKDNAMSILEILIEEDIENDLMLHFLKENIELYYDYPNNIVKNQFIRLLEFYDLIPNNLPVTKKRTVLVEIQNQRIRKTIQLKRSKDIERLIEC